MGAVDDDDTARMLHVAKPMRDDEWRQQSVQPVDDFLMLIRRRRSHKQLAVDDFVFWLPSSGRRSRSSRVHGMVWGIAIYAGSGCRACATIANPALRSFIDFLPSSATCASCDSSLGFKLRGDFFAAILRVRGTANIDRAPRISTILRMRR
jgi:hypothetical protein